MLVDTLGRPFTDLRISVTDRCSFRCVYCMPREIYDDHEYLPRSEILTYAEIVAVARAAASVGVSKFRLTGGEPLLRREVHRLVEGLAGIPGVDDLAMTTNGHLLADQASELAAAGLDRVTVSLDGIDDEVVRRLIDTDVPVSTVLEAIDAAAEAGLGPIKINAVVRRGWNDGEVLPLLEHFRFSGHTVRFIEYMDVGTTNAWDGADVVPSSELVDLIGSRWPIEPIGRTVPNQPATEYTFTDGGGTVGFISSVSEPFCGDCSRMRLSAEGVLYTCLFASSGTDVKGPLRAGATHDDLVALFTQVWEHRGDRYSELRGAVPISDPRVEMSYIGG